MARKPVLMSMLMDKFKELNRFARLTDCHFIIVMDFSYFYLYRVSLSDDNGVWQLLLKTSDADKMYDFVYHRINIILNQLK